MSITLAGSDFAVAYLGGELHIKKVFGKKLCVIKKLLLSEESCEFCMPRKTYLGQVIDKSKHKLDPSRVSAIKKIFLPRQTLQCYKHLGSMQITNRYTYRIFTIKNSGCFLSYM